MIDGNLQCEVVSAPVPEPIQPLVNRPSGPRPPLFNPGWISERFGHMCSYYGKRKIKVIGNLKCNVEKL